MSPLIIVMEKVIEKLEDRERFLEEIEAQEEIEELMRRENLLIVINFETMEGLGMED